jgi:phosphoserine aminotransferase
MVAVEDALDGLKWAQSVGGKSGLIARSEANLKVLADWTARTPWVDFLAGDPAIRSCTSICLKIVDPDITVRDAAVQADVAKKVAALLEKEGVAYDIASYRDAPAGLRIWGGATIDTADMEALTPWLDWAFATVKADLAKAA